MNYAHPYVLERLARERSETLLAEARHAARLSLARRVGAAARGWGRR